MNIIKSVILELVGDNAIKGAELAANFAERMPNVAFEDYQRYLEELVKAQEIMKIEYCLPSMSFSVKSIYFPKNTEIRY